jgi:DNA-binding NarL/FixJ family response regulator
MINEQVAKQLFISLRTVNWHLTAIYTKLGLRSRTEAARSVIDHGLR